MSQWPYLRGMVRASIATAGSSPAGSFLLRTRATVREQSDQRSKSPVATPCRNRDQRPAGTASTGPLGSLESQTPTADPPGATSTQLDWLEL